MRRLACLAAALLTLSAAVPAYAQDRPADSATDAEDAPVLLALSHLQNSSEARLESTLREVEDDWTSTRYRYGGASRNGIDCSALMMVWFRTLFGVGLPRTAAQQAREGEPVLRDELRAGDLVFFSNGGRVSHVGVYLGAGEFAHSASSRGVSIATLSDEYWGPRYRTARRVLPYDLDELPDVPSFDFDLALEELDGVDLEDLLPEEVMEAPGAEPEGPAGPSTPAAPARSGR